ncbi:MAG: hypothetical protein CVU90_09100 [Firmicutes bacterium HGW-Firmicutes-15]|nr:MAG: hypothetical protein CVU90_09100 [Firmicutes bacterium HGW-Firmicutes-15]
MAQLIVIILIVVLVKLLADYFKPIIQKSKPAQKGDFIDISEKWINADEMPYRKNDNLLDKRELAIFQMFQTILNESSYSVYPHLRLADLLKVPADTPNRQEYLYRIKERSLDMVVFESIQLMPVLVIKLKSQDDGKKQQINDDFTENALNTAGLKSMNISLNSPPTREQLIGNLQGLGLKL